MNIKLDTLLRAKPEHLLRLAKSLNISTDGLTYRQVAELVFDAISPKRYLW